MTNKTFNEFFIDILQFMEYSKMGYKQDILLKELQRLRDKYVDYIPRYQFNKWEIQPGVYLTKEHLQLVLETIDNCCVEEDEDPNVVDNKELFKLQYSACLNTDEAIEELATFIEVFGNKNKKSTRAEIDGQMEIDELGKDEE